jgi:multidrug efflux pump subunit AcrA (membrane-fusion protein)
MALTPVTKQDRASGVVRISPPVRVRIGVNVAPVETRPLVKRVVASGEVVESSPAAADRASITARVYRGDAHEVQPGQPVRVSVPELPITEFVGTVELPRATDAPGALRLVVDDPGHALHPGMRVEAQLDVELSPRLVVPAEAVVYAGPRRIVFVEHGSGRFEPRTPKLGITASGLVEVLGGLVAGERVVVKGTFLLAAENRLRSDGSLWGDLSKPAPVKPPAPAAGAGTPEGSGW